jgi:hypothetical protein
MPPTPSRSLGQKQGTGAGTNAGVTVTLTGAAGERLSATEVDCSGDAAALVTLESPASTVTLSRRLPDDASVVSGASLGRLSSTWGRSGNRPSNAARTCASA